MKLYQKQHRRSVFIIVLILSSEKIVLQFLCDTIIFTRFIVVGSNFFCKTKYIYYCLSTKKYCV